VGGNRVGGGAPCLAAFARRGTCLSPRHNGRALGYPSQAHTDFNVWTERIDKLRYMHRNPVERGLVESAEHWRWSSFRWYLYGEAGAVRINDTDILQMRVRRCAA
jgi:hypothetical protein